MTEFATGEKKVVSTQRSTEDLSKEMEQSMEREPDEQIKIVRVFGNCYRCNWWVQDKASQPHWLASGKIRRSALVRATKTNEGLRIEQMT